MTDRAHAQRAAVVAEARTWLGTPYHHHGRIKAAGVDCAMLLAEVFSACDLVPRLEPGHYPTDWHIHSNTRHELFEAWVLQAGGQPVHTPALGDVGLWRYGRTHSHGGIVVGLQGNDIQVVHAYVRLGVVQHRTTEQPLAGRPVRWYSIIQG